jgi:Zn-finger nucleic acid-binding protein
MMRCPHCDEELEMADRQGIEIDYCPNCRGVWLDRGELDKIIERSAEFAPQPSRAYREPDYRHPQHHDSDYYRHKKHKSLLGELFDF